MLCLLRLIPFLVNGHRQLALENLACASSSTSTGEPSSTTQKSRSVRRNALRTVREVAARLADELDDPGRDTPAAAPRIARHQPLQGILPSPHTPAPNRPGGGKLDESLTSGLLSP